MHPARALSLRPLTLLAGASLIVIGGMLFATPAEAGDYRGHGGRYHGHGHHHYRGGSGISLNFNTQPYYAPQPVYYAPQPVYYAPRPVYAPVPTYYAPPYVYYGPAYYPPRRHVSTNFNFNWR